MKKKKESSDSANRPVRTKKPKISNNTVKDTPQLSADNIMSLAEKTNIEHLIASAFLRHEKDRVIDLNQQTKELNHMVAMLEEYLSSFLVIGYTMNNEPVAFKHAPTTKDDLAILELFRNVFFRSVQQGPHDDGPL